MSPASKHILRSTGIIGAASVLNVLIGIARTKAAALILGPAGIGLIGLFHNLITLVASLASFGIGNVSTRQLAEAADRPEALAAARRAFFWATLALALIGGAALFLFRDPIAQLVLGDAEMGSDVGWLSLGAAMLVVTFAQNGLLTGLRRIGDIARVSVYSALLGSIVGVGALLVWRESALLFFVLASPAATVLVGLFYAWRLPRPGRASRLSELLPQWRALAGLGLAFTIASVGVYLGQLGVRSIVQRELGLAALGHFQASWVISANYIGFILTAMASEYYPRLTSVIRDPAAARTSVNQQAEFALLLSGPVLVGTIGLGPWLIPLLFSSQFLPALEVLRWQIAGDLLKITAWSVGMVLLASGHGRAFAAVECSAAAVFVLAAALLTPLFGLEAAGMAYLVMYLFYVPVQSLLARKIIGFSPSRAVVELFFALVAALLITITASLASPVAGAASAILLGIALALLGLHRLRHALPDRLVSLATLTRRGRG